MISLEKNTQKNSGDRNMEKKELSPKVQAAYKAVIELFSEGADLNTLTVSEITARAGIGKGTVYDYFSNKEEMLAGALYYEMSVACQELYEKLQGRKNLYEKMEQILLDMEAHKREMECAFKVLQLLTDNSQVSKKLRELLQKRKDNEFPLYQLLKMLVEDELGNGEQISGEDMLYIVMNAISKLVCYAMYLNHDATLKILERKTMRERLCRDICREVDSCKNEAGI